ncbi:hypothetical protein AB0K09_25970, partial [Streptomyces sp. NPDC049577]
PPPRAAPRTRPAASRGTRSNRPAPDRRSRRCCEPVVESPAPGEVVWRDDTGVTCRRWNWRQCTRTRLTLDTTRAVFILDALEPMDDERLGRAGEALTEAFVATNPGVRISSRLITARS